MANATLIFVVGMHRSGSSAVTRLVNLLGAGLGTDLLEPQEGVNVTGFWEHRAGVEINESMLERLGSAWFDYSDWPDRWWRDEALAQHHEAIRSLVRDELAPYRLAALKDPRLCRLLPVWREALADEPVSSCAVLTYRHPDEVARSLWQRDRLPKDVGYYLWLNAYLAAERHTREMARSFVGFDAVLDDWRAVASRIAAECGVEWAYDDDTIADQVAREIRGDLRHWAAADDGGGASEARELALRAFAEIEAATAAGRRIDLEAVRADYNAAIERAGAHARLVFEALQAMVAARRELMDLGQQHSHALEVIDERDGQLRERNKRLDERDRELGERDQQLELVGLRLRELQARVRDQDAELRAARTRLATIENDWLWRWYVGLRRRLPIRRWH